MYLSKLVTLLYSIRFGPIIANVPSSLLVLKLVLITATIKCLFTGTIKVSQLSGPVGIYEVVGAQAKAGVASILYIFAFLSINVGFINLLPLPAFDGGHILFVVIEKIKGSPVKPEVEAKFHAIGLFLLMLLMVYVTFNDILRLF